MYANRTQSTYEEDAFSRPENQIYMYIFFSLEFMRTVKGIPYVLDSNISNSILKISREEHFQGTGLFLTTLVFLQNNSVTVRACRCFQ